jgi:hypothetical protein
MLNLDVPYYNAMESRLAEQVNEFVNSTTGILVYPNPVRSEITIEPLDLTMEAIFTVKLIDQLGQIVLNKTITAKTLVDVSALSEGVYQVVVLSNNQVVETKKITIVK